MTSGGVPALIKLTIFCLYGVPEGPKMASTLTPGFWSLNSLTRARLLSACSWLTAQKDQETVPPGLKPSTGDLSVPPPAAPHAAARVAPLRAATLLRNDLRVG